MTVCTFAGHREVYSSAIEADIESALSEIMQTDKRLHFILAEWAISIKSVSPLCGG